MKKEVIVPADSFNAVSVKQDTLVAQESNIPVLRVHLAGQTNLHAQLAKLVITVL